MLKAAMKHIEVIAKARQKGKNLTCFLFQMATSIKVYFCMFVDMFPKSSYRCLLFKNKQHSTKRDPFTFFLWRWRLQRQIRKMVWYKKISEIWILNPHTFGILNSFICVVNNVFFVCSEQSRSLSSASCRFSSVFYLSNYKWKELYVCSVV